MCLRQTNWSLPVAKFAATRWCKVVADRLAQDKEALAAIDRQPAGTRSCRDDPRTRRAVASYMVLQRLQPLLKDLEELQSHVELSKWVLVFKQLVDPVSAQLCDYVGALKASINAVDATVDCGTSDSNPPQLTAPVAPDELNDAPAPPAPSFAPPLVPLAPPAPSASAPAPADDEEEEASVSPAKDLTDREKLMTGSLKIIPGVGLNSSTADDSTAASQPNGKGMSKSNGLLRRTISHQGSLRYAAAGSIFQADKILRTLSENQGNFQLKPLMGQNARRPFA